MMRLVLCIFLCVCRLVKCMYSLLCPALRQCMHACMITTVAEFTSSIFVGPQHAPLLKSPLRLLNLMLLPCRDIRSYKPDQVNGFGTAHDQALAQPKAQLDQAPAADGNAAESTSQVASCMVGFCTWHPFIQPSTQVQQPHILLGTCIHLLSPNAMQQAHYPALSFELLLETT